jgi:hypothetical protein
MPKNAKTSVYKEKEFEMYSLWKSMPAYFRGMKKSELLSYGFNDPMIQKIFKIKSQTEFAKVFRIKDLGTLTDWNNKLEKNSSPSSKINNILTEQIDVVSNKISSQPEILLKSKIREQQQLISSLKKEVNSYKNQLKVTTRHKTKVATKPLLPKQTNLQPITPQDKSNFLSKIKSFVIRWK